VAAVRVFAGRRPQGGVSDLVIGAVFKTVGRQELSPAGSIPVRLRHPRRAIHAPWAGRGRADIAIHPSPFERRSPGPSTGTPAVVSHRWSNVWSSTARSGKVGVMSACAA